MSLWERAVGRPRWQRDDALLTDQGAPSGLGDRNRALLLLRNALFSRDWALRSDCPACGSACEFVVDSVALAQGIDGAAAADADLPFDWRGRSLTVRAPDMDDLRSIACRGDAAGAVRALLARCLPDDVDPDEFSDEEIEAVGRWMERLDPAAAVMFALTCPACDGEWQAPLDIAEALWAEVKRCAELLLTDVDALARAYGWSEEQVINLSPVRRAAYLQMVAPA